MTKITFKTDPNNFDGTKMILRDGVKIASYWFLRDRRDVRGRVELKFSGKLYDASGRELADLSYFVFDADVRSFLREYFA